MGEIAYNIEKRMTKRERHKRLVRLQRQEKESHVSQFGRDLRLHFLWKLRAEGRMKRASNRRKKMVEQQKLMRGLEKQAYNDWFYQKRPYWQCKRAVYPEPDIGW